MNITWKKCQYLTIYIHEQLYYFSLLFFVSEPQQSYGFFNNPVFRRLPFFLTYPTSRRFYFAMYLFFLIIRIYIVYNYTRRMITYICCYRSRRVVVLICCHFDIILNTGFIGFAGICCFWSIILVWYFIIENTCFFFHILCFFLYIWLLN